MTAPALPVPTVPPGVSDRLRDLQDRWAKASPAERSNYQLYLIELTEALGVRRPLPAMPGDVQAPGTAYRFDYPISVVARTGEESTNFIDLFYGGHFALEAKDQEASVSSTRLLVMAFGQVNSYARDLPERPPYIMVLDVGKTLLVWDRWSGSYGGFNAGRRIELIRLADNADDILLLRDIWTDPSARDPRTKAQAVTKDIAARLAKLAAALEDRGHDQEKVARFLMRCVFSCFAEDIQLLPDEVFRKTVQGLAERGTPEQFSTAITGLWKVMDEGGWFGALELRRFNGHFFKTVEALPLTREDIALLVYAAQANWASVEPSIFGTLLVRALDPHERHRLGAEYTPRAFIERVVRPTVEEPIRERWTAVQAEVLQLRERGKPADLKKAERSLRDFHAWLRGLTFLDPACGSGNFLYVTLDLVKRVEVEVIRAISDVTGQHALRFEEVGPGQFYGIEINQWAREIAELTLWIGFHQFWKQHHNVQPDEPILRDTGTLDRRDAVLAYDRIAEDPERSRLDPTPRVRHPVTGTLVPDPGARLAYHVYENIRPAEWPRADFIVGNPPYIGNKVMRDALGDGYVDALRAAYDHVPDSADYVMYWWYRAAEEVAAGRTTRAGLITTKAITQPQHQRIIADAAARGAHVVWTIPNHPWVEDTDGAAVRVAMTVLAHDPPRALRVEVDDDAEVVKTVETTRLNSDLSAHADVPSAAGVPLLANAGLSSRGYTLVGRGFVLQAEEANALVAADARHADILRRYMNGKDVAQRTRGVYVIDFAMRSEGEAREYPVLYDLLRDRVQPERAANARASYARLWWRFGEPRAELRPALLGLSQYIATPYVSKHRFFTLLEADVAPDEKLVAIASDSAFHLGVLSSRIHETWALAAGGRHGVGNDPSYNNSRCFDAFPFPDGTPTQIDSISSIAQRIDRHRSEAVARDPRTTVTGIYNVVAKLRSGDELTAAERVLHEAAACWTLADLHQALDSAVAAAYGWNWPLDHDAILERLVRLHDERIEEERSGHVRWLREAYQRGQFAPSSQTIELAVVEQRSAPNRARQRQWPRSAVDQMSALQRAIKDTPLSIDEAVARFKGAKTEIVARHFDTLALLGEIRQFSDGRFGRPAAAY